MKLKRKLTINYCISFLMMILLQCNLLLAQTGANVTVDFKGEKISVVLREIEKQTGYNFSYNSDQLATLGNITYSAKQVSVETALKTILGSTFTYEITGKNIVIMPSKPQANEKGVVKGRILDDAGQPLPGASITLKGSKKGVLANQDGTYSIEVPGLASAVLEFNFLGMKTESISVKGRKTIDVILKTDDRVLAEVVVVGAYGMAQKRSDMVGSAFQLDNKQLESLPKGRVDQLLDGMAPGISIQPNSDSPSSTRVRNNVRIRGDASMSASNEPLWVVDGTTFFTGDRTNMIPGMSTSISPLTYLDPNDIESITVLKDAASTSIYGANGANGVVLIKTKSGRKGKTMFRLSARNGVSIINQNTRYKVLDGKQYLSLAKEAYLNAGKDPELFPFQDNDMNKYSQTNTDWSDVYYTMGNTQEANIAIIGGSDKSSFYISGSYFQNKSTVDGNVQQRYSIRSNNDIDITDRLSAHFRVGVSYNTNKIFNPGTDYYDLLPIFTPYNEDGSFRLFNKIVDGRDENGNIKYKTLKFFNNVAEREQNDNNQKSLMTNVNASLEYNIAEGLKFTTQFGIDYQSSFEDTYSARTNWSGMTSDGKPEGYASKSHVNFFNWTNINRLNYSKSIGRHNIGALVGSEMRSKEYHTLSSNGSGFVNDHIREVSYAVSRSGSSSASIGREMSFFGQASYNYDQKYYLSVNFRKDGNSSFGKDVRWVNFGSIGASWNIHNEKYFKSKIINLLKLKASFGTNGNSRIGSEESLGLYSYNESDNYAGESGGSMSAGPNPKLSWETTYMLNIGLRAEILKRFDIEIEAYNNKTVDLLSNIDVSRTTGDTRVYRNIGSIQNRGIELTVSSKNIITDEFSWQTDFNMSHNSNKLLELYNGIEKVMGDKIWREDLDMNTYYLIRWAGVDPRDGAPLWYDANGGITRVYSIDNRVPGKSSTPDLYGGITNTFMYKNWTLRIMANYTIGGYAFSSFGRGVMSDGLNIMDDNQSINQLDRWQNPGDLAMSPKLIWGVSTKSIMNSTRFLHSKTNIRLQNVALSYTLENKWLKRNGIKSCQFSLIGDNLGVWTPYDKTNRNSYKQSMSGYPMESTITLSIDMSF
jgi:TonB-linked SusC/RagA family outer membrane protein